jgi:hypothetical protein
LDKYICIRFKQKKLYSTVLAIVCFWEGVVAGIGRKGRLKVLIMVALVPSADYTGMFTLKV